MTRVLSAVGRLPVEEATELLTRAGVELREVRCSPATPAAELIGHLRGCVAVIAGMERYSGEVFAAVPELRHIARLGVGYDAVDVDAATAAGVLVSTVPGTLDAAVADLTFALILDLARRVSFHDRSVRRGEWNQVRGVDVWRKTLGLVGLGRIGRAVATRAKGFEMRLLAYEPYPDLAFVQEHGVELVSLEELLRQSDFVSLHLPLSAATVKFLNAERLALMKPTAYLINTARGGLVDEDALEAALREGRIAVAGLDVRAVEPPRDNRFAQFDTVVLTPHIASNTAETRRAMALMAVDNVLRVLRGERPHGLVNPEAWERAAAAEAQRSQRPARRRSPRPSAC